VSDSPQHAIAVMRKASLYGKVSACFFLLVVLLVADGLQALMRDDFSRIDLFLGGQTMVSGAMPFKMKSYTEIIADIEGLDGLEFTPFTDFKGFWFGAHMWRATLDAKNATATGRAVLTVVDLVPAKSTTSNATIMVQNPTQIYNITVWPSAETMQAAHYSLSRRLTGLSAFVWAGLFLAVGIAIGIRHYFWSHAAHKALALEGIFVVHGMKTTDAGCLALFFLDAGAALRARCPMVLLSPEGVEQEKGVLQECTPRKGSALFPSDGTLPRYGWLLCPEAETDAVPEPVTLAPSDPPPDLQGRA
jgi:hypothetical protein